MVVDFFRFVQWRLRSPFQVVKDLGSFGFVMASDKQLRKPDSAIPLPFELEVSYWLLALILVAIIFQTHAPFGSQYPFPVACHWGKCFITVLGIFAAVSAFRHAPPLWCLSAFIHIGVWSLAAWFFVVPMIVGLFHHYW